MRNGLSGKGLVLALIALFVGASAVSSISGNTVRNTEFVIESLINEEFAPGEFIVKFEAEAVVDISESINGWTSTGISSIDVLNEKHHVNFVERLFTFCKKQEVENSYLYNIFKFSVPQDSDILSIVQEYSLDLHVVYAEPNYIAWACTTPNDPDFDLQWALHNTGQTGGTPDADIDAPEAWDIETGDENIVIAISDSGVDWDHPDLAANIWVNSDEILDGNDTDGNGFIDDIRGWDFVNDDNDPMDDNGHGTCCAGIAGAATDNNIGVAGVCWNCSIMPVKGLDSTGHGTFGDCADGVVYAVDNDADVISMSFGSYSNVSLMKDAVDYAYNQGAVLVAAAGNDATDQKWYPAGYDNVIGVAATNYKDIKISASNYGFWVDVAAPGWDVYTTGLDDNYTYFAYTSCATPHVAGLAGLILSKTPSYSPAEVKSIIRNNTDPYESQFYIGTGRINAYKALIEYNTPPDKPDKPSGETQGKAGVKYTYSTSATDPQDDQVYYLWDWGDGNTSGWLGLINSGETATAKYTWAAEGDYEIKVKAKDRGGAESEWSDPLSISMPKNKAFNFNFNLLSWLFERFPNAFPILRHLIGI